MNTAMNAKRVFIHGLEGSRRGTKARFFKKRFPDMIIEDFQGSFQERMNKLEDLLSEETSLVLVGSSFGGLMAAVYATNHETSVRKLILLAPALAFEKSGPFLSKRIHTPTVIVHGREDDVVPAEPVRQIAQQVFADLTFDMVEDDHFLTATFPILDWDSLIAYGKDCH